MAAVSPNLRVLFVCLGNICRSPTADAVFCRLVEVAGLAQRIEVDSAGTGDWHIGQPPDRRTSQVALERGYDLSALRARQVDAVDFERFDYILAMDEANHAELLRLCPQTQRHKISLFLSYAPQFGLHNVPDPYYGGSEGFNQVLDLVEAGARGLLAHLRDRHFKEIV